MTDSTDIHLGNKTRRRFLGAGGIALLTAVAGCIGGDDDDDGDDGIDDDGEGADDDGEGDGSDGERADDDGERAGDDDEGTDAGDAVEEGVYLELLGVTVTDVAIDDPAHFEMIVGESLSLDSSLVRADASNGTVEVFQDASPESVADSLAAAGIDVSADDVRRGVTSHTQSEAFDVLSDRLQSLGYDHFELFNVGDGLAPPHLELIVDGEDESHVVTEIDWWGELEIVASYPDPEADDSALVTDVVLVRADIDHVGETTPADASGPDRVPVELTSEAAERFVDTLVAAGFTDEGVGMCLFDEQEHDGPQEGDYCLLIVLDGEYIHGASMSHSLAERFETDRESFVSDPRFTMQTGSFEEARRLEATLVSGRLPTAVRVYEE